MNEEMRTECVDMISTATERMVKEQMDKKYNENWIVIIGKGFSFEVTHEVKHVLWMYNCDIGVLCYKAGARQVGTRDAVLALARPFAGELLNFCAPAAAVASQPLESVERSGGFTRTAA